MNFTNALNALQMGNRVAREIWRGKIAYWALNDEGKIIQVMPDGSRKILETILIEDVLASDWWTVT